MKQYFGIGVMDNNVERGFSIFFGKRMFKASLWSKKFKRPVFYWYNKVEFLYQLELNKDSIKIFLGFCRNIKDE